MYTAGTRQLSVASVQCLPLAAPMQPVVAADGGGWHRGVSCPANWAPHLGWRGCGLPGPTLLFPLKCLLQPASQLLFPLPIPSHPIYWLFHCTMSTVSGKPNPSLPRRLPRGQGSMGPASASSFCPPSYKFIPALLLTIPLRGSYLPPLPSPLPPH